MRDLSAYKQLDYLSGQF